MTVNGIKGEIDDRISPTDLYVGNTREICIKHSTRIPDVPTDGGQGPRLTFALYRSSKLTGPPHCVGRPERGGRGLSRWWDKKKTSPRAEFNNLVSDVYGYRLARCGRDEETNPEQRGSERKKTTLGDSVETKFWITRVTSMPYNLPARKHSVNDWLLCLLLCSEDVRVSNRCDHFL